MGFPARAATGFAALSGDEQCIIFSQLCNVLDPGIAVAFSSTSNELWALTPALPGSNRPLTGVDCRVSCARVPARRCLGSRDINTVRF